MPFMRGLGALIVLQAAATLIRPAATKPIEELDADVQARGYEPVEALELEADPKWLHRLAIRPGHTEQLTHDTFTSWVQENVVKKKTVIVRWIATSDTSSCSWGVQRHFAEGMKKEQEGDPDDERPSNKMRSHNPTEAEACRILAQSSHLWNHVAMSYSNDPSVVFGDVVIADSSARVGYIQKAIGTNREGEEGERGHSPEEDEIMHNLEGDFFAEEVATLDEMYSEHQMYLSEMHELLDGSCSIDDINQLHNAIKEEPLDEKMMKLLSQSCVKCFVSAEHHKNEFLLAHPTAQDKDLVNMYFEHCGPPSMHHNFGCTIRIYNLANHENGLLHTNEGSSPECKDYVYNEHDKLHNMDPEEYMRRKTELEEYHEDLYLRSQMQHDEKDDELEGLLEEPRHHEIGHEEEEEEDAEFMEHHEKLIGHEEDDEEDEEFREHHEKWVQTMKRDHGVGEEKEGEEHKDADYDQSEEHELGESEQFGDVSETYRLVDEGTATLDDVVQMAKVMNRRFIADSYHLSEM